MSKACGIGHWTLDFGLWTLFRHKREAEAGERPVGFEFDFVDVGEIAGRVAADGVAGGVALLVSIETKFERLGLAPRWMKERADEVEDGGRADRQTITLRQKLTRAPIFADDAHEFAERDVIVIKARGVRHPGTTHVVSERIGGGVEAVGCAVELPVARQVTRLLRRLHADNAPLMFRVPCGQHVSIARRMIARVCEFARSHAIETRRVL